MSVTNYENITCKYSIEKLDKMVYFVPESAIGSIIVDGSVDYVHSAGTYQAIECYSLSISEGDTLDERFEFTHSLNFSVNGYMNKDDIEYRYVIVKDLEGTYWLLNPRFPCKLTYTYTLDATSNHTDFVVSTKSNFPMLRVQNFNPEDTRTCSGYNYCGFDYLELNDTRYSKIDDEAVYYTNDGFKLVKYLKNTATLTETYDGNNVSHEVKFNINFDDYKSSWHYTLLEFQDNKYAAVISTKCGTNIACGFGYGLQPSFTVTASDTQFNSIEIKLSDLHDQGHLIWMPQDVPYSHTTGTTWVYVQDEYECVNSKQAKHLLMQEYDFFGNPLDNYKCLEGYQWQYGGYNIVGTYPYSSDILFNCKYCKPLECGMETSIPKKITFTESGECKAYSIKCDSFFTLSATSNDITVYPISGEANTYYSVRICNFAEPTTSGTLNYEVILNYCNDRKKFKVDVVAPSPTDCLPQGQNYNISSDAQYVRIPTSCCIASADCINSVNAHSFQIQEGYVLFRANDNQTGSERQFIIKLIKCDSTTATVYVTQTSYYSRWVVEERVCNANQMCDFERMYSGATPENVNTPTYMTRWNNCSASTECATQNTRWVETSYTGCSGTRLHLMEQYQISYDNGQTWINTGQMRYGREIPDTSLACSYREYRWTSADTTTCVGYNLYQNYKKEESVAGGAWTVVSPLTLSYDGDGTMPLVLVDSASTLCGYVPPIEPQYRWETLDPNVDWYCDGVDKWLKDIRQISTDGGVTWSNVTPYEYRKSFLMYSNSTDCGYVMSKSNMLERPLVIEAIDDCIIQFTSFVFAKRQDDYAWRRVPANEEIELLAGDYVELTTSVQSATSASVGSFSASTGHFKAYGNIMSLVYRDFSGKTSLEGYENVFENLFKNCSGLTSIDNLVMPATTLANGCYKLMFYKCSSLTAVPTNLLPSTVLADSCYYGMFEGCSSLTTAPELPATTLTAKCYELMFNMCTNINYIKCLATDISASNSTTNWVRAVAASGTFVTPSSTNWSNGWNGIPYGWTRVNAKYMPTPPTPSVYKWKATYTGGTVSSADCDAASAITDGEITLEDLVDVKIGDCVTTIGTAAFSDCYTLSSVTIPNSVTSIGSNAFYYCYSLSSIDIPNSVTTIGDSAFEGADTLTSVVIPNSVTSIGVYTFIDCTSLTSVTIGNGITTIAEGAFNACMGLTSITIPDSVTSIGYGAFAFCRGLTSVTIPNSVTSIGAAAFNGCRGLTSVTIGSGVTSIGGDAFWNCSGLTSITVEATTPPALAFRAFDNTNDCPIYVPSESVSAYQTAWSSYANRIQAIPNS